MHDELTENYRDMIYAETAVEVDLMRWTPPPDGISHAMMVG